MTLGERLKECLELRDITQQQLADMVGSNFVNINNYANDRVKRPPLDVIQLYAEKLNVNPAYLAGWSDKIEKTREEGIKHLPVFQSIPSDVSRESIKFMNDPIKKVVKPSSLIDSHDYIGIIQDNDAMEPIYRKGDLLYVDITANKIFNGSDILISVDYFAATVNRVELEGDKLTLIPLNSKYPERTIDLERDNYNIIGIVSLIERDTLIKLKNKEDLQDYLLISDNALDV